MLSIIVFALVIYHVFDFRIDERAESQHLVVCINIKLQNNKPETYNNTNNSTTNINNIFYKITNDCKMDFKNMASELFSHTWLIAFVKYSLLGFRFDTKKVI